MNAEQQQELAQTLQGQQERIAQLENHIQTLVDQQSQVVSRTSSLKPPKPDTFDGKHVDTFIYALEKLFEFHHVQDEKKVDYAVTYFRGSALRWFKYVEHQYAGQEGFKLWNNFTQVLRKHFEAANTETVVRNKLNAVRQMASVSIYNDLFNSLIIELLDIDEKTKIDMYCRGLKTAIQLHVSLKGPKTLEEAQTTAMNVDNIMNESYGYRSNGKRQGNGSTYNKPSSASTSVPMELGNTEESVAYIGTNSRLSPEEMKKLRLEKRCFKCKKTGHIARKCNDNQKN
jgi:hypothetical protein